MLKIIPNEPDVSFFAGGNLHPDEAYPTIV